MTFTRRSLTCLVAAGAIVGGLALCAAWAGDALARRPLQAEAVIPVYLSSKRPLVMMRIGDHPPAPVVFDTGTNDNILDTVYAEPFELPRIGPSTSIDGNTGIPVPGYQTHLVGVRLGGAPIADAPANVFDYRSTDEVGIFGPNSFPGKLVLLDLRNAELRILPGTAIASMQGPGMPYLGDGAAGLPSIPIVLPSGTVDAILDSGNDSTLVLPLDLADELGVGGTLKEIGKVVSASGSQPVYEGQVTGDIKIGPVTLNNPVVRFFKAGRPLIGLPVLLQMTLAFDPSNGRSWVIDAHGAAD
ncbi:aspartyl protease family protein [Devosia sp. LjRoot16]|uniref:aspartyl protease family protein n=1 Tax=Devosia sp. LjRoot16 TaxID=3342271 RepID=UPI003ECD745F